MTFLEAKSGSIKRSRASRGLLFAAVAPIVFFAIGCSGDKPAATTAPDSAVSTSGTNTKTIGSPSLPTTTPACVSEELSAFDRVSGEILDIDQATLPHGLYLATSADLLIESKDEGKSEGGQPARLLVREIPGEKSAEIVCAENLERLGDEFEMNMTGPVKFETGDQPSGSGFTARQFYVFHSRYTHGVHVSNAKIVGRSMTLKQAVSGPSSTGQLLRLDERTYLLKLTREREGTRARLFIRLELVPQG